MDRQKYLEKLEKIFLDLSKMSEAEKSAILALIEFTEKSVWVAMMNKRPGASEFSIYLEGFKQHIKEAEERYKKLNKTKKRVDTLRTLSRIFPKKKQKKDPIGALKALKMNLTYQEVSTPGRS